MVLTTVTTIGWETAGLPSDVDAVIVSLPVSVVSLVVVSLLTGRRREAVAAA